MLPLGNQKQRVENHLLIFALWVQDTIFSTYKNSTSSRNRVNLAKKKGICLEEIKSEFCVFVALSAEKCKGMELQVDMVWEI